MQQLFPQYVERTGHLGLQHPFHCSCLGPVLRAVETPTLGPGIPLKGEARKAFGKEKKKKQKKKDSTKI